MNITFTQPEPVKVLTPQDNLSSRNMSPRVRSIFLAGTIDNGNSHNWQKDVIDQLSTPKVFNAVDHYRAINIFNPRRDNWGTEMEPVFSNPVFYRQVSWEHKALELANTIIMNFEEKSFSPISLLELGLFANRNKLIVRCPTGYYRKGNVDYICEQFNIPLFETMDELLKHLDTII